MVVLDLRRDLQALFSRGIEADNIVSAPFPTPALPMPAIALLLSTCWMRLQHHILTTQTRKVQGMLCKYTTMLLVPRAEGFHD
jgi:hypothetical protein